MTTPAPESVLAVFAHPDDESLSAGGLLARHAAAGARTAVVTTTWTDGTHRAPELAEALRHRGAAPPRVTVLAAESAGVELYPDSTSRRGWTGR